MKTVWIVSEGSPGHISQSTGLVDALAAMTPLQTVIVQGRATVRGWLRPLVRWLMGPDGRPLPDQLLQRVSNVEIPAGSPPPDLIVSSGGKSVFAARSLAVRYGVPYVYIGERKPYPATWFHTVISPAPGESSANSVDVELIPTQVTPAMIAKQGEVELGLWCMIIGGASRSHHFREQDWIDLATGMNTLAEHARIRWLLTTSRRTGAAAEAVLKAHITPDTLEEAIWWADAPRRDLYKFMARAAVLFVTQDSVTMVTEAVSAGKPVVVVAPDNVDFPQDSFLATYLDRLAVNGRIIRYTARDIRAAAPDAHRFQLLREVPVNAVAGTLVARLQADGYWRG